jgi:hypothetical protein
MTLSPSVVKPTKVSSPDDCGVISPNYHSSALFDKVKFFSFLQADEDANNLTFDIIKLHNLGSCLFKVTLQRSSEERRMMTNESFVDGESLTRDFVAVSSLNSRERLRSTFNESVGACERIEHAQIWTYRKVRGLLGFFSVREFDELDAELVEVSIAGGR